MFGGKYNNRGRAVRARAPILCTPLTARWSGFASKSTRRQLHSSALRGVEKVVSEHGRPHKGKLSVNLVITPTARKAL